MLTTTVLSVSPEELKELINNSVQEAVSNVIKEIQAASSVEEKILSRKEAARELGVTYPTLKALSLAGHVKTYRIGSNIRYKKTELMKSLIPYKTDIVQSKKRDYRLN